jgi:hypothetical protein
MRRATAVTLLTVMALVPLLSTADAVQQAS